ncbi:molybdate ABC transporter substrate-binding protein [Arthrobacter nitrophenolicus]|uniref:Molybdate transport system substrate-binding protein n=2 Tax=Arthrobacter nitrophenolicus TaxID=683150 RepID=A0ACC6TCM4_9MICC|nr:molybdate ABC transporter substrate-binding protein [Arthrobacter nitrophenolicus]ELT42717.1 molybdenum ABC transporter periplasmic molybdate-binding protein [Arthrobacter nitrophenolicus]
MRRQAGVVLAALVLAAGVLAAGLAGCSGGTAAPGNSTGGAGGTLTVFAAASLKSSFTELAGMFEAQHPGTDVTLSFAGSSDLATQISQGAPADVFASADTRNMDKLRNAGLLDGDPQVFATNTLAIAVPPGNPARISSFADLSRTGTRLVTCAVQVPCGAAAAAVAEQQGADLDPVSEENSVTDVLGKVVSGEADAGLVYATDIRSAGDRVESVPFPEAAGTVNSYPVAAVAGGNTAAARAFVDLVAGPEGRQVLERAGFGAGAP